MSANGIEQRRLELRGGRSVRQVSRDQHELDVWLGEGRRVRNRMTWATNPAKEPLRVNENRLPGENEAAA